jgi:hypothetical protein
MSAKDKKQIDNDEEWDKNPSDDDDTQTNVNVKQVKAETDKPSKLKDLFSGNKDTQQKTKINQAHKNQKPQGKDSKPFKKGPSTDIPKFVNTKKQNNDNDKPLTQAAETNMNKAPKDIKDTETHETKTKLKVEVDIAMPTFSTTKEGKLIDLNANEDVSI